MFQEEQELIEELHMNGHLIKPEHSIFNDLINQDLIYL